MPVGRVSHLHMGPMTFTEFLRGHGMEGLAKWVDGFEWSSRGAAVDPVLHGRLLEALRLYQFVGGMPEAVSVSHESSSRDVQAGIIEAYRDDFQKYAARRDLVRMLRVFNFAARQAGQKVKYSNISAGDQSATLRRDIELLAMARVISKVTHSHCSGLLLQAEAQERVFKLIFLDVGLMNALCGLSWSVLVSRSATDLINAGSSAKQFIGQHLQNLLADRPNRELTYWLREGRSNNAELDYVAEFGGRIVPIEVKAGRSGTMKSLHQFAMERQSSLAVRFDAQPPSLQAVAANVRSGSSS